MEQASNDSLSNHRNNLAKKYVQYIDSVKEHKVLALDAPWGSGKTTMIEYMEEHLKGKPFITYNAWENDYTDEPLISLMNEIFEEFERKGFIGKDKLKPFINNINKATVSFTKATLKAGSRIFLGSDATKDMQDAIKAGIASVSDEIVDNTFMNVNESKNSRIEFKTQLKEYVKKILDEKDEEKLIIIIDELDRCKPTFAIELLENIKHLFDIDSIVFFIAVDNKQLAESIKGVYGQSFDAETYLHRFFDLELHLNKQELRSYFSRNFYERIAEFPSELSGRSTFLDDSINTFNLTLRDINKIINEISFLGTIYDNQPIAYTEIYLILLILKYKRNEIYKMLTLNKSKFLLDELHSVLRGKQDINDYSSKYITKYLFDNEKRSGSSSFYFLKDPALNAIKRIEETL